MYRKEEPSTIQTMFNSIAKRYDLANAVLSLQLHKRWNDLLIYHMIAPQHFQTEQTLIDLCCGTGDIAFHYLKTMPSPCQAYLVDFCSEMLACAKEKSSKFSLAHHQVHYVESDVQALPFPNELADCTTLAYGIRNVKDPVRCIQEIYRVLKPGGRLGILELTRPSNRLLHAGHQLYLKTILPMLGKWLTNNKEAYQYLKESIHTFISPRELESILIEQGFTHLYRQSLAGGIATIIVGYKTG